MKAIDYINALMKERDELKELCKTHAETIRLLHKELIKKDKKIQKLEKTTNNENTQKEFDKLQKELDELFEINREFESLKVNYENLQCMYNDVVEENKELKSVIDEIERMCDSDFDNK